jgi:hypothetical protein
VNITFQTPSFVLTVGFFNTVTTHNGHCYEFVKSMSLDYDAIVVLSGDGLVHELFNAFAVHTDPKAAFAMPVVQIPTGSANGFSIALLGLKVCHLSQPIQSSLILSPGRS